MTVQNPAIFLQEGSHPAEDVRRALGSIVGQAGGLVSGSDLVVSENSAGADMSIDVAGGAIWIAGTEDAYQGVYYCENRGVTNIPVQAADVVHPRIDLVVARVYDSSYSGTQDEWALDIVTGTPAASPVAPSLPANSFSLATINVAANATTVVDANITDTRVLTDETITGNLVVGGDLTVTGNLTAANQGSVLITPTSVTGGTLSGATVTPNATVSSVTVDGVFSSDFDSYRILVYISEATTNSRQMTFTFIDDGGSEITTGYSSANFVIQAGTTTRQATDGYNQPSWDLTSWYGYTDTAFTLDASVMMPYVNNHAVMHAMTGGGTAANVCGGFVRGSMNAVDVLTGFKITSSAGTFSGGTIRVYGYSNG